MLPLSKLDGKSFLKMGVLLVVCRRVAKVSKPKGVPRRGNGEPGTLTSRDLGGFLQERRVDGMRPNLSEPVFGVPVVRFLSMQDSMPVRTLYALQFLNNGMTFGKAGKIEPQPSERGLRSSAGREKLIRGTIAQSLPGFIRGTPSCHQRNRAMPRPVQLQDGGNT